MFGGWIRAAPTRTKEGRLSGIVEAHDQDRVLCRVEVSRGVLQSRERERTAHLLLLHEMADKASHESIHCSSSPGLLPCRDALTSCSGRESLSGSTMRSRCRRGSLAGRDEDTRDVAVADWLCPVLPTSERCLSGRPGRGSETRVADRVLLSDLISHKHQTLHLFL